MIGGGDPFYLKFWVKLTALKFIDFGTNQKYACDFLLVNNTNITTLIVSKLLRIIGQILAFDWGCVSLTHLLGVNFSSRIRN